MDCQQAIISAPFGSLLLEAGETWLRDIQIRIERDGLSPPATPVLREAARQFDAYFQDPRHSFELSTPTLGTPYQQRVWQALCAIPPGEAHSYQHIAAALGSSPRAVAAACRANHFPLLIPCHRAVGSHGLGGFCGATDGPFLDVKRWLLRHEGYGCC